MATPVHTPRNIERAPEQTRSGRTYVPAVDIIEREDELLLLADVPGAQPDGVDINYERGELTIVARVPARDANPHARCVACEYGVGDFVRSFRVGEGIDAGRIQAELNNGVLTLHLPKAEQATARKIAVQSDGK